MLRVIPAKYNYLMIMPVSIYSDLSMQPSLATHSLIGQYYLSKMDYVVYPKPNNSSKMIAATI